MPACRCAGSVPHPTLASVTSAKSSRANANQAFRCSWRFREHLAATCRFGSTRLVARRSTTESRPGSSRNFSGSRIPLGIGRSKFRSFGRSAGSSMSSSIRNDVKPLSPRRSKRGSIGSSNRFGEQMRRLARYRHPSSGGGLTATGQCTDCSCFARPSRCGRSHGASRRRFERRTRRERRASIPPSPKDRRGPATASSGRTSVATPRVSWTVRLAASHLAGDSPSAGQRFLAVIAAGSIDRTALSAPEISSPAPPKRRRAMAART